MSGPLRKPAYLHLMGTGSGVAAIILNGPISHDTGIAVAICIVTLLGVQPLPMVEQPDKLKLVVGSITGGGLRQGQFIKTCFGIALLLSGATQQIIGANWGVPTLLLGAALGSSAIANEFEIQALQKRHFSDREYTSHGD